MFEKGCEKCREWQEHYYWEHMDVGNIRFFRLMIGDFAHRVSIPEKFVKSFNGQITQTVDMKTLSGETWHVGVTKNADELFFGSGWEDFVRDHELQENDLLLFTCRGNSSFEVQIFEASGCEKVSSIFGNTVGSNMCRHFNNMAGQQAERHSLSNSEDTTTPPQLVGSPHDDSILKKYSSKTKPRKKPESSSSASDYEDKQKENREGDSDEEDAHSKYYYSRSADRLSNDEKREIISLASIQPDNPAFVTILQMSSVRPRNNCLTIHSEFAADHIEARSHEIILRRTQRKGKWYVIYHHNRHTRCFRGYHLSKFVRENKLREGDVCIFELMKGAKRVTMSVHVIRKANGRFVKVV